MQAERCETRWATLWIAALVAEVLMLMLLAARLREPAAPTIALKASPPEAVSDRCNYAELNRELDALSVRIERHRARMNDGRHCATGLAKELAAIDADFARIDAKIELCRGHNVHRLDAPIVIAQPTCYESQAGGCGGNGNAN